MRYLNNFEGFKVGDYIIGHNPRYTGKIRVFLENNVGKIINIKNGFYHIKYEVVPQFATEYTVIDGKLFALFNDEIRRATPEEIENQKVKNAIGKYNL